MIKVNCESLNITTFSRLLLQYTWVDARIDISSGIFIASKKNLPGKCRRIVILQRIFILDQFQY